MLIVHANTHTEEANKNAWVYAEEEEIDDEDGEDYVQFPKKLPLLVDEFPLMASDALSVRMLASLPSSLSLHPPSFSTTLFFLV